MKRVMSSAYMQWAKKRSGSRYNLATSGLASYPLSGLPVAVEDLDPLTRAGDYGYPPLQEAVAAHCGVAAENVVTAAGTSMANMLAMAAILEPGDEVLVEHPTYELLLAALGYLQADIHRFPRRAVTGFALDPAEVERAITPRTRLVVITNLHNPSSAFATEEQLRAIGAIARRAGARVLVDEVYLDAVYEETPRTSAHLGPEFVVTSSLTKVYGLSGLRCGWILAQPDLARAMWQMNNLLAATPVYPGELLSVAAFQQLDRIREKWRRVVEADRVLLNEFLDRQTGVSAVRTGFGTTSFMRLRQGDAEEFLARLRAEFETSVAPGRFFGMSGHFRVGMGVNTEMFGEGLRRIGACLAKA